MKTIYEVRHCGRSKKIDNQIEALRHGKALSDLGYYTKVYLIKISIYTEQRVLIYQSN